MLKTALTYGIIAGLIIVTINTVSYILGIGYVWLGFLVMLIAFSMIFVAVKRYREDQLGGVITFGKALQLGLGIVLAASVIYVAVWEIYQAATGYQFIHEYSASLITARQESGASQAEIDQLIAETEQIKAQYQHFYYRLPMTFIEIFPIGLLVALIAAFTLRNHKARA